MLKRQITKEQYNALEESLQALYVEKGSDDYRLDIEADPNDNDTTGLKNQVDRLLDENRRFKAERENERAERERAERERQEKEGNHKALYESAQEEARQYKERLDQLQREGEQRDVRAAARNVANAIAAGDNNAEILAEFVERRLKVVDGEVKVTDERGNPTVSSYEDLKREFKNSPRYAALVKGNQASGGGAAGDGGGGAGKSFADMNDTERRELYQRDPDAFQREVANSRK